MTTIQVGPFATVDDLARFIVAHPGVLVDHLVDLGVPKSQAQEWAIFLRLAKVNRALQRKDYPPFCASSPEAAAMDDGEFWENVEAQRHGMTVEEARLDASLDYDPTPDEIERHQFDHNPCPICGGTEACSYDAEGNAMIHVIPEDFDA